MKFTKTAVALAIAGMAAAPMIASADTTLSGVVQLQFLDSDADDLDARIGVGDVLVGVSTSHELNSGLTGYGSLRIDLDRLSNDGAVDVEGADPDSDIDDVTIGSAGTADSVFVGIKGGFGDLRFGEVPNAVELGQMSTDIYDVAGEVNGGISYTGGFGPATVVAQWSPEENSDVAAIGIKFGFAGFNIGVGGENRNDDTSVAVGASYAIAGFSVAAHFWNQDADDTDSVSVRVGYGFGGTSASIAFATRDGNSTDDEAVRFDIVHDLGGGTDVSARVETNTNNLDGGDTTAWRIQLSKGF